MYLSKFMAIYTREQEGRLLKLVEELQKTINTEIHSISIAEGMRGLSAQGFGETAKDIITENERLMSQYQNLWLTTQAPLNLLGIAEVALIAELRGWKVARSKGETRDYTATTQEYRKSELEKLKKTAETGAAFLPKPYKPTLEFLPLYELTRSGQKAYVVGHVGSISLDTLGIVKDDKTSYKIRGVGDLVCAPPIKDENIRQKISDFLA